MGSGNGARAQGDAQAGAAHHTRQTVCVSCVVFCVCRARFPCVSVRSGVPSAAVRVPRPTVPPAGGLATGKWTLAPEQGGGDAWYARQEMHVRLAPAFLCAWCGAARRCVAQRNKGKGPRSAGTGRHAEARAGRETRKRGRETRQQRLQYTLCDCRGILPAGSRALCVQTSKVSRLSMAKGRLNNMDD
jgi:hypothetical protein